MILLLGSSGYVGQAFIKYFRAQEINYTTASVRFPLDIAAFRNRILKDKISHVINCTGAIGSPNVDACETARDITLLANAILPQQLAQCCAEVDVKFIHISSGCIFNDVSCERGHLPQIEYTENDTPNFCFNSSKYSWYSATKALGETLVKDISNTLICRLRIPFNGEVSTRNYIQKICQYPILLNATNSFSNIDEFVAAVTSLYNRHGIYNLTQPGSMTTRSIINILQQNNLCKDKLFFRTIEEFEATVATPRSNCVLNSTKAIRHGAVLTPIEDSMRESIEHYSYNIRHA